MSSIRRRVAIGLDAARRRARRARSRVRRHLVARAGLGQRPRGVPPGHLELDRPRVPAQRRLDALPRAVVAADDPAGAAGRAPAAARPRAVGVRCRPARERGRPRAARRARSRRDACADTSPTHRRARARRSSGPSSPIGSSISSPRRSSWSGCCSRRRCPTGPSSRSGSPPWSGSRSSRSRGSAQATPAAGHERGHGVDPAARSSWRGRGSPCSRRRVPLAGAILLQCCGWLMQLLAVYVAMQAFDIDAPLPAAGLVLVLMNIATIVPLWPGNVGLVQAAVALPLRNYGVPYADRIRLRHRAAGDRDGMRDQPRPHRARARGDLLRGAPAHGGRGAVRRERARGGSRDDRGHRARDRARGRP